MSQSGFFFFYPDQRLAPPYHPLRFHIPYVVMQNYVDVLLVYFTHVNHLLDCLFHMLCCMRKLQMTKKPRSSTTEMSWLSRGINLITLSVIFVAMLLLLNQVESAL